MRFPIFHIKRDTTRRSLLLKFKQEPDAGNEVPSHVPVTFSVTGVRSIQSVLAQPVASRSEAAMNSWAANFIRKVPFDLIRSV